MFTILHASDLHFGKPFDPAPARALKGTAEELAPDLMVLSGDFTQRAKVREYEAARAFIQDLPELPLVVTPGNHDVPLYRLWERIFAPLRNYKEHILPDLDTVTRLGGATVVSLNSTAPLRTIVNGRVGDGQLRFAAHAFQGAPDGHLKIVVAHHNLAPAPDFEPHQVLPGYQRCLEAFEKMGVDLILGGHLHRGFVARASDWQQREGAPGRIIMAYSGTTTSRRGRGRERNKNSLNQIRVTEDRMVITHHVYFPESDAFVPTVVQMFPRQNIRFFSSIPLEEAP